MCLLAVKLDHGGQLFWDTPSRLSAWVSVFWAWRMDLNKGVPTLFAYWEKLIWKIFFKFKQGTCPWMAFAWNFFGIFLIFLFFFWRGGRVCGQIIYREYIYFGAQIFPVVWPVRTIIPPLPPCCVSKQTMDEAESCIHANSRHEVNITLRPSLIICPWRHKGSSTTSRLQPQQVMWNIYIHNESIV